MSYINIAVINTAAKRLNLKVEISLPELDANTNLLNISILALKPGLQIQLIGSSNSDTAASGRSGGAL